MKTRSNKYAALIGIALCTSVAVNSRASSSIITFSVDMSAQINAGTFVPGTDSLEARGTFNGWGTSPLVLVRDGTGTVYTNTMDDTSDANAGQLSYKFWNSNAATGNNGYEATHNGQNRVAVLPANSGDTLILPTAYFSDAGPATPNSVTFQVDMAQQITLGNFTPGADTVEVQGDFQGWVSGNTLFQEGTGTVYTNTFQVGGSPGQINNFKYVIQPAGTYEQPSYPNTDDTGNRFVANAPQTLPVVYFSDQPPVPPVTNDVLFQVDMSVQVLGGRFDPANDTINVNGSFNGWSTGNNPLTNNLSASNTNIYSAMIRIVGGASTAVQYKFAMGKTNDTFTVWEGLSPNTPQIGGNRYFYLADTNVLTDNGTNLTLPVVYFSDLLPSDVLPVDTMVTFHVNMAFAQGTTGGTPFDPSVDQVVINGDWLGWWGNPSGWTTYPIAPPPYYILTNNPVGSTNYQITMMVPRGTSVPLTYKYGIYGPSDGVADNEAAVGDNHYRFVRQSGSYDMPQDTFGNMYVEPSFGELAAGAGPSGTVSVSWLGRPGVQLQSASDMSGAWTDLFETDGSNWVSGHSSMNGFVSVTNYPAASGMRFFRLVHPTN